MKLVMKTLHLARCPTAHSKKLTFIIFSSACAGNSLHYENQTRSHSEISDILKLLGEF